MSVVSAESLKVFSDTKRLAQQKREKPLSAYSALSKLASAKDLTAIFLLSALVER